MSWVRPVLNLGLRLTEKRHLARESDPARLRARFEARVRRMFPPPPGVTLVEQPADGARSPGLLRVVPQGAERAPVLLYFHGGGYVFGSPRSHAHMVARLAQMAGIRAVLPWYRLAPEHPYPAAPEDASAAWDALIAAGIAPGRILLGGDSAGGGLALALLAGLCAENAPMPAGLVAFSPLTDLTFSGPSYRRNARAEALLPATRDRELVEMYLRGADPARPDASPLFARFPGAPPVFLTASDIEILLDDTRRMAAALDAQGVETCTEIPHGLPHVWPFFWRYLPEGRATLRRAARWISRQLPPSADS